MKKLVTLLLVMLTGFVLFGALSIGKRKYQKQISTFEKNATKKAKQLKKQAKKNLNKGIKQVRDH